MSARFTFFGGKGGVGKTTCAAAAAVRAASEGARVLVVSTDPAHSLADALAAKLGREPRAIPLSRSLRSLAPIAPRLHAVELDADRALTRWLGEREDAFRTIAERGTYLDEDDVERILGLSLPGVDELVGLLELGRLAETADYDEVVVDTAPTGHTVRLFEMPDLLKRFGEVLDDMHAKHRFLARSLGGRYAGDFADDVIAGVVADGERLQALLRDVGTSVSWVLVPEEMAVEESRDGIAAISSLGVSVRKVIVNRIWPRPDRHCQLCSARVFEERKWISRARSLFSDFEILGIPARVLEPRGVAPLLEIARSVREIREFRTGDEQVQRGKQRTGGRPTGDILLREKLVLVGGKGGVGKSSVAAALALQSSGRVLLLSTDPAHSLGDVLSASVGDSPVKVGPIFVREMDARAAFAGEKAKYASAIDSLFSSMFRGNMDAAFDRAVLQDLLDLAPPGIDEVFGILSIVDALFPVKGKAAWDRIVVDTAPTGHTLRLLGLPRIALEWVHAVMEVLLKYQKVIGLGSMASDLLALAKQLRALVALLRDRKRCGFVAVTRPAELPRLETERLVEALDELEVPLAAVVVNAITMSVDCSRCEEAIAIEAPELERMEAMARRTTLVHAPASYPAPRGPRALAAWRATWRVGRV